MEAAALPPLPPQARDVGIVALELYFPRLVVEQEALERSDGCPGKYTVGLGQRSLCFCGDREDTVSMAATAALRLLERFGVHATEVGKLEVGTETGVDRSKSLASHLAEHFSAAGNTSLHGSDHQHGCYGGAAALLAVCDWVASPSWDGRYGLAVAADLAVYPEGSPARPTGGCGAAAMLVGPNAPLALEPWPWRASYAAHAWDFFKPHGHPLFPVVDGPATTAVFAEAFDACAARLHRQLRPLLGLGGGGCVQSQQPQQQQQPQSQEQQAHLQQQQQQQLQPPALPLLPVFSHFVSHAPYNKIVRKVFARLVLQDLLRCCRGSGGTGSGGGGGGGAAAGRAAPAGAGAGGAEVTCGACASGRGEAGGACIHQHHHHPQPPPLLDPELVALLPLLPPPEAAGLDGDALPASSVADKSLERALLAASAPLYEAMAAPAADVQRQLGNLYTASLFSGLAGLVSSERGALAGRRVLMFAFGSGVVASLFVLRGRGDDEVRAGADAAAAARPAGSWGYQAEEEEAAAAEARQQQHQHHHHQQPRFTLGRMADTLQLPQRLAARLPRGVEDFNEAMAAVRAAYGAAPYEPGHGHVADLGCGTVHLARVDERFRRFYARTPPLEGAEDGGGKGGGGAAAAAAEEPVGGGS